MSDFFYLKDSEIMYGILHKLVITYLFLFNILINILRTMFNHIFQICLKCSKVVFLKFFFSTVQVETSFFNNYNS